MYYRDSLSLLEELLLFSKKRTKFLLATDQSLLKEFWKTHQKHIACRCQFGLYTRK